MVRIASKKQIGSKTGTIISSASGVSLGSGTVSAPTNIQGISSSGSIVKPGPSLNQLGTSGKINSPVSSSGIQSGTQNANTEYKLSIASMLLAMKNQALGSLSLGGSKAGGSITENFSGVNLG